MFFDYLLNVRHTPINYIIQLNIENKSHSHTHRYSIKLLNDNTHQNLVRSIHHIKQNTHSQLLAIYYFRSK